MLRYISMFEIHRPKWRETDGKVMGLGCVIFRKFIFFFFYLMSFPVRSHMSWRGIL